MGSVEKLGSELGVSGEDLVYWLQGTKRVPLEIFLRAVDIVVAHDSGVGAPRDPKT